MFLLYTIAASLGVVIAASGLHTECHWTDRNGSVCAQNTTTFPATCVPYCAPFKCDEKLKDACQANCLAAPQNVGFHDGPICHIACDVGKLKALSEIDLEHLTCTELKCCWHCNSEPPPAPCRGIACSVAECALDFPVEGGFFPQQATPPKRTPEAASGDVVKFLTSAADAFDACNSTDDAICTLIREVLGNKWPVPWPACDCKGDWYKPEIEMTMGMGVFWAPTVGILLFFWGIVMMALYEAADPQRKAPKQTKRE